MRHTVLRKQPNSKSCMICGLSNPYGLCTAFFELEDGRLLARFTARAEHQGYPGRLHGGMATAILDETIGRAIMIRHGNDIWGVTMQITTRFRQPVPLLGQLQAVARITRETRRHFEGTGEILLPDHSVAVEGHGKYLKMPIEEIADFDPEEQDWRVVPMVDDPEHVELGGPKK